MKKDFTNLCNNSQKINPTVYLNINEYKVKNKVILHIYVHESSMVHNSNGIVYDRNIDGDYKVERPERIANIYMRKQDFYTENRVFPYAQMSDLREDLIQRARQMAISRNGKNHPWSTMTDEEMLRSLNLIEKDLSTGKEGLTLAAILLFGKDTTIISALPHHKTDAIYRVKNLDRYDDRDDIRTNLIESFDRLMDFVDKHLDDKFYIEGNQRIDVRNKIARELCCNLLIHRELSIGYPAKLIIEKDKMWTENANRAKRIGKIDINDYAPYPKNPKIAKVFKEIGLADELGSGVRNMTKYTKIYSNSVPELNEDDIFTAIIPLEENSEEFTKKFTNEFTKKFTNTEIKIIELVKENPNITQLQLSENIGISKRAIIKNMNELKEKQVLKRIGNNKKGYWKIIK